MTDILYFLLVLFLPTQFGKHFWPDFAFISGARIDYLSPTIYLTDILVFCLVFIVLKNNKEEVTKNKTALLAIALVFLFLSIGVFLSQSPFAGWYGLLKLFEFVCLGAILVSFFKKQKYIFLTGIGFSAGIVFQSILAVLQFIHQGSVGGILYFLGERFFTTETPGIANASLNGQLVLRPYGTFPHPNVLAGFLVVGMLYVLYAFFQKSSIYKWIAIGVCFVGTIGLIISFSRVATIAWILCLLFFLTLSIRKKIVPFLGIFLIGIAGIIFLTPDLRFRFFFISPQDQSIVYRFLLFKTSLQMVLSHPIFGVGWNNFLFALPYFYYSQNLFSLLQPVHNIFFLIAAQTGIFGLFFSVGFCIFLYKKLLSKPLKKLTDFIPLTLLTVVIILGLFDHYFLTLQQGELLLTCIIALAVT